MCSVSIQIGDVKGEWETDFKQIIIQERRATHHNAYFGPDFEIGRPLYDIEMLHTAATKISLFDILDE